MRSLIGQNKGISSDTLAASAAFLSWISTGTIACAEDGEHHRPNRAAETSRDVFVNLETVAGTLYTKHGTRVGEVEKQLMRQVHPWLPSFSGEFTCSVPMTRIRDIAHRGDIPQELKKEIKYTLQNKIHRNAGPEDLVAVQAMWERVEHSDYSEDFKYQFRLFNEELRRFFNAAGATERLDALAESLEEDHRAAADDASAAWYCADAEQQIFGPLSVKQLAGSLLPDGAVFTRDAAVDLRAALPHVHRGEARALHFAAKRRAAGRCRDRRRRRCDAQLVLAHLPR